MKQKSIILPALGIVGFFIMSLTHGLRESAVAVLLTAGIFIIYYGLRFFIKEAMNAIFFLLVLVIGLSFLKASYQLPITVALVLFLTIVCIFRRQAVNKTIAGDSAVFKTMSTGDAITWFLLLLYIVSFGFMTTKGFFTLDFLHPSYELSIGRSYELSVLKAPDLSYSGKFLRYHFLSTQLPAYFSHTLKMPLLSSLYFFVPYFLLLITFFLIHFFFAEFPLVRLPMFLLFFTPLLAANFMDMEGLCQRVFSTNSYLLAFLLTVISIYYLAKEYFLFFIAGALLLILIKASFFLVLLGGVVLYLLRTWNPKKLAGVLSVLLPGFVLSYMVFLTGAHQHNSWIVFPTVLYGTHWTTLFIPAVLLWSTVSIYWHYPHDRILLALSSVSLAGMLGALLLTEVAEANSVQFLVAAYFATGLVFWYWFQKKGRKRPFTFLVYGLIAICFVTSFASIYREPIKNLLVQNIPESFFEKKVSSKICSKIKSWQKKPTGYLSQDLIDAYTWVESNIPQNAIVLFSKHYEVFSTTKSWWPETGFMRSALSGKQMYCENYKYKSIGMEKDFPLRFANTINFYNHFVLPSASSRDVIESFYHKDFTLALLHPKREALKSGLQKYLHPEKEFRWANRAWDIYAELKAHLMTLPSTEKWATDFIRFAGVGYIILEMGDRPSAFLQGITVLVYKNATVSILKVREGL